MVSSVQVYQQIYTARVSCQQAYQFLKSDTLALILKSAVLTMKKVYKSPHSKITIYLRCQEEEHKN